MKRKTSMVTTGITSLFLIFVVLSLAILSLLSLGNSKSDRAMSMQALEATVDYYRASSQAADFQAEIQRILLDNSDTTSYDIIIQKIKTFDPLVIFDDQAGELTKVFPISEDLDLEIILKIMENHQKSLIKDKTVNNTTDNRSIIENTFSNLPFQMKLISCRTIPAGDWHPDKSQNLLIR